MTPLLVSILCLVGIAIFASACYKAGVSRMQSSYDKMREMKEHYKKFEGFYHTEKEGHFKTMQAMKKVQDELRNARNLLVLIRGDVEKRTEGLKYDPGDQIGPGRSCVSQIQPDGEIGFGPGER